MEGLECGEVNLKDTQMIARSFNHDPALRRRTVCCHLIRKSSRGKCSRYGRTHAAASSRGQDKTIDTCSYKPGRPAMWGALTCYLTEPSPHCPFINRGGKVLNAS